MVLPPELSTTLDKYIRCRLQKDVKEILKKIKVTLGGNWRNLGGVDDTAHTTLMVSRYLVIVFHRN